MFKPVMLALASLTAVSFSSLGAEAEGIRVKITAGDQVMTATFYDNATTRALVSRFPLTLPMEDLYGREMCYRFPDALPANETQTSGYEVGDVVYWAPRHSFVIMYEQNNERIGNLQKVGRIHSGVGIFRHAGNIDVTFEMAH
ncbi:cyclophilin-like fold protein [Klebsiella michiganensis]